MKRSVAKFIADEGETASKMGDNVSVVPVRAPMFLQFKLLFWREFMVLSRKPFTIFLQNLLLSLVGLGLGAIFANLEADEAGAQNRLGVLFFFPMFLALTATSAVSLFINDRPRYWRQTNMGMYTAFPYFLAKTFSDLVLMRVFPPLFMSFAAYPMIGLQPVAEKFWIFVTVLMLMQVFSVLLCYVISAMSATNSGATLMSVTILVLSIMFGGLLLNLDTNDVARDVSVLSGIRLAYEALCINEFTNLILAFPVPGRPGEVLLVDGAVVMATAGVHGDRLDLDISLLGTYCLICFGIAFVAMSTMNQSPMQTQNSCWKRLFKKSTKTQTKKGISGKLGSSMANVNETDFKDVEFEQVPSPVSGKGSVNAVASAEPTGTDQGSGEIMLYPAPKAAPKEVEYI